MNFSFFLKKKDQNLFRGLVDFHNHILPAIDDGSQSLEQSLKMLKCYEALEIERVLASPHIYQDLYPNTPKTIQSAYEVLDLKAKNNPTKLIGYAAEYMVDEFFIKSLQNNAELLCCFDKAVLIEIPYFGNPDILKRTQFELQNSNYKPILAHPERYLNLKNLTTIKDLKVRGVKMQLNALSLTGFYGAEVRKKAYEYLRKDIYDFIGTDAHNEAQLERLKELHLNKKDLFIWQKICDLQSTLPSL